MASSWINCAIAKNGQPGSSASLIALQFSLNHTPKSNLILEASPISMDTPQSLPSHRLPRYPALDGWRGISILCVLAAHMLPLGLKSWQLNITFALLGMSLFFALSGFLITSTLIHRANVRDFLIRRFFRILPLAWAFLIIALPLQAAPFGAYLANFLFYANLDTTWITPLTAHFWSLCVEMQFYLFIAFLFGLFRQRGLLLLPAFCLVVTGFRILHGQPVSIATYARVDEILVGACLALINEGRLGTPLLQMIKRLNPYLCLVLLLISCHPASGVVRYFRPYFAVLLVGSTLHPNKSWLLKLLNTRMLAYIGEISYALYVIHPITYYGWLGSGDKLIVYAKRPLSFALTFGLAHLSTYYYESHWIAWGKKLTQPKSSFKEVINKS
ncbi:MAG: acyltransferase [Aphanocapsa sp. GSE-SYN-MK-11-07L]|nr:acyltransferase [Aphanocapsa sp. GSE-SYN-MK-11-07L]